MITAIEFYTELSKIIDNFNNGYLMKEDAVKNIEALNVKSIESKLGLSADVKLLDNVNNSVDEDYYDDSYEDSYDDSSY